MQDFAKLFHFDGIGQVLVTLETPQSDDDCDDDAFVLRFRIAGTADVEFSMGMFFPSEQAARRVFEGITAETALITAKPILSARKHFLVQA